MMDLRFKDAPEQAIQIMRECIQEHFPELLQAKILILMDLKKRESQRAIVLGRILKTNDLQRHLSIEESGRGNGYDYIVCLDNLAWSFMEDEDKIRLIRHELRHADVAGESEKNPFKIRCHTIEDFFSEVKLNEDDPHWSRRVGEKLMTAYELQKDPQQKLF